MWLQHKIFGEVAPLEASYHLGHKVVIVRLGDGETRNIFVGDTRWASSISEVEKAWRRLRAIEG